MIQPHFCRNQGCRYSQQRVRHWCVRDGHYTTIAHGRVQRYRCRQCGCRCSAQSESMHYYAKRRVDLKEIGSRLRGGSSMRDIGRELGCSRTAVANAS